MRKITMNNKKIYNLFVSLFIAVLVISGCSNNESSSSSAKTESGSNSEDIQSGGELTYALATSPDTLDPHRNGWVVATRVINQIYDSLVELDENNEVLPRLATEWTASEDGKSYTFKLREDVTFHDGTPFNAEAVKYSYDRILNPETKAGNASALLNPYESSEVIDEYTIKINLSEPSTAFLGNLSQPLLGIVSPTAAEKYGDEFGKNPVGTGLFKFVSWTENSEIKLEKNPDYAWGPSAVENKGAAYLDKVTFKIVPEEATRLGGIQSGQLLAAESIPPQNLAALESDQKTAVHSIDTIGLPYTLFFNQASPPYDEVNVRKAILLGVDVDSILKTLYLGHYTRAWSPLTPGIIGFDKSLENSWKYDVKEANKLLDEAGFKVGSDGIRERNGKKLTLNYVDSSPNREKRNDIAAIIQQQLKEIGVAVELNITQDFATVVYQNGNYDVHGNSQSNTDPNALKPFYTTGSILPKGINNAELDKLLQEGSIEVDPEKRVEIYKQVQKIIIDEAYIVPIYVFPYIVGTSTSVVDLKLSKTSMPVLNDVKLAN